MAAVRRELSCFAAGPRLLFWVRMRTDGVNMPDFTTDPFLLILTAIAAYLAGSIVASAAPTPGGLGAAEAALVAGLTVAGLPQATAVPAVLLFRLMTYWVPILPGWLALRHLQRAELV